ncbi:hypothetical protein BKA80DRAFT_260047 [Phyllosticta citrichinensis]
MEPPKPSSIHHRVINIFSLLRSSSSFLIHFFTPVLLLLPCAALCPTSPSKLLPVQSSAVSNLGSGRSSGFVQSTESGLEDPASPPGCDRLARLLPC